MFLRLLKKKSFKSCIRESIFNFLILVANTSVKVYSFFYLDAKLKYSITTVLTFGDVLRHIQLIKHLNFHYKKKIHIISINQEPSSTFLPFFFNKEDYFFYNEFIYLFTRFFLNLLPHMEGLIKEFDHEILKKLIINVASHKYYLENYSVRKDNVYKRLKKKHPIGYLKCYLRSRIKDNKTRSLYKIKIFEKKYNLNFKNNININEYLDIKHKLNINKKYICLHIRYRKNPSIDLRGVANLDSYNLLINFLINRNYQILVMGTKKDNFIFSNINNDIIYYKDSLFQNHKNDLLLIANCEFYIGNTSGPMTAAEIFDKPSLIFDHMPFSTLPENTGTRRYCLKKIVDLKIKRELSFFEICKRPIFYEVSYMKDLNLITEELSPEEKLDEIKKFIIDMDNNEICIYSQLHSELKKYIDSYYLRQNDNYKSLSEDYLQKHFILYKENFNKKFYNSNNP
jgi:putative glycosyltransferase (TIGR04372 family)